MKKKILVSLLAVFALSIGVGCGGKNNSDDKTNSTSDKENTKKGEEDTKDGQNNGGGDTCGNAKIDDGETCDKRGQGDKKCLSKKQCEEKLENDHSSDPCWEMAYTGKVSKCTAKCEIKEKANCTHPKWFKECTTDAECGSGLTCLKDNKYFKTGICSKKCEFIIKGGQPDLDVDSLCPTDSVCAFDMSNNPLEKNPDGSFTYHGFCANKCSASQTELGKMTVPEFKNKVTTSCGVDNYVCLLSVGNISLPQIYYTEFISNFVSTLLSKSLDNLCVPQMNSCVDEKNNLKCKDTEKCYDAMGVKKGCLPYGSGNGNVFDPCQSIKDCSGEFQALCEGMTRNLQVEGGFDYPNQYTGQKYCGLTCQNDTQCGQNSECISKKCVKVCDSNQVGQPCDQKDPNVKCAEVEVTIKQDKGQAITGKKHFCLFEPEIADLAFNNNKFQTCTADSECSTLGKDAKCIQIEPYSKTKVCAASCALKQCPSEAACVPQYEITDEGKRSPLDNHIFSCAPTCTKDADCNEAGKTDFACFGASENQKGFCLPSLPKKP